MKRIALALAALLALANVALAGSSTPPTLYAAYPPSASDLDPRIHLSNLTGQTAATVCGIGDSTFLDGPNANNSADPTQTIWGFLQAKLKSDNPQITSWTFSNFAIGGANELNPTQTGAASGLTLPSWFTNSANTWLSYVQAGNCDVLGYLFGTNSSTSGQAAGNNASTLIRQNMEIINGWTKVPNVLIITNKSGNPATDQGSLDDSNESAHMAQAAFHRTFARSNAAGYTSFPNLSALGFGLLDLGRDFTRRVVGFDPDAQYFQAKPGCLVNGFALGTAARVGVNATTVCTTTHGDYRLTFVIPAGGGTTLFNYGGGNRIQISAGEYTGNYIGLNIGGTGNIIPRYIMDGSLTLAPTQVGSSVNTTNGQDVTVTVTLSGMTVKVWINGTLALDVIAPRFISGATGGTPINVNWVSAPSNSPTINVTEFWEGIGAQTTPIMSYTTAFGPPDDCGSSVDGCQAGNGINHQRSGSAANDNEYIKAVNFHVPPHAVNSLFASTADATINTTGDLSCFGAGTGSKTIPANKAVAGTKFHLTCRGNYTTPAANAATLTAKVKWGATTIASVTTGALPASATKLPLWADLNCTIRSVGATGTIVCNGGLFYDSALVGTAPTYVDMSTTTPQTIDTTAASALDITGAWSSVAGSQSITSNEASVVQLN